MKCDTDPPCRVHAAVDELLAACQEAKLDEIGVLIGVLADVIAENDSKQPYRTLALVSHSLLEETGTQIELKATKRRRRKKPDLKIVKTDNPCSDLH